MNTRLQRLYDIIVHKEHHKYRQKIKLCFREEYKSMPFSRRAKQSLIENLYSVSNKSSKYLH